MLSVNDLASKINDSIAATDGNGQQIAVTPAMKTYASAIISTLQSGLVNNAPATVTATGIPGSPIPDGAASSGLMTLIPATWVGVMLAGNPTSNPATLATESTVSTGYLMASGLVSFSTGSITGVCTATPTSPGILAAGAGSGGMISGLDGNAWAAALTAVTQGGPLGPKIYTAVADYIKEQAQVTYAIGTIVGTFAPGGGPLIAGTGIGGSIT